jgi:hypothetical protein
MSDIDILSQMLKATVTIPLIEHNGRKQVYLEEPQCCNSSFTIYDLPENTIVIKADSFKCLENFFDGSKGECKRADFIIMADSPRKKIILCIEMKKTKGTNKEIIQQLNGAQCLVLYCKHIGIKFWGLRDFLDGYKYRFISIGHTSIAKRRTRVIRQEGIHDKPDKMMKIYSPNHLQFNQLAGC